MSDQMLFLQSYVVRIVAALAVLVVGWVLARVVGKIVTKIVRESHLNERAGRLFVQMEEGATTSHPPLDLWIGKGVFYLMLIISLGAFFQILGLTVITEPIRAFLLRIFEYLPNLIGPAILIVVAWLVATALRFLVRRTSVSMKLEERVGEHAGIEPAGRPSVSRTLGDAVYWLTFLVFLPAILSGLDLGGLLEPVQGMIDKVLSFLPNLLGAIVILAIGWFIARIVQKLVSNLLLAIGTDGFGARVGVDKLLGTNSLSRLLGVMVYVLILVPVLIAALNALKLDAVTRPASDMLTSILSAVPSIFAAVFVLAIAYFVARVLASMATNVLQAAGFDGILARLGMGGQATRGERSPSEIAGYLVLVALMLFASVAALNLLEFRTLARLMSEFLVFTGQVILGLVIFAVGLYLANLVSRTVLATSAPQARLLALVSRVAILVLAGAIGLRHMGLANEIVIVAFALIFGAVSIAAAVAFGIGGRNAAGRLVDDWSETLRNKDDV